MDYLVGKITDIPDGEAIAVQAGRRTIAVLRIGREVFAISNSCPHKGAPLCDGKILADEKIVRCPWHHWNWQLEHGTLEADTRQKLRTYQVLIEGDDVIVKV
jgi:NAD(P)H-dependent nitrite reductase small subunit